MNAGGPFHRLPHPALRDIVDRYWGWNGTPHDAKPWLPLMPGPGGLELFFHHRRPFRAQWQPESAPVPLPASHTVCLRSRPLPLHGDGDIGFIAVRIRAGCAGRLLPIALPELCDQALPLDALWGAAAAALADALVDTTSPDEQTTRLDEFLLARLRNTPDRDAPIRAAAARLECEPLRIAALAREAGLSTRQFETRFRAMTGATPARFRRLARLRRSIKQLLLSPHGATLAATMDEAYFDQAQQIREFREFTGRTPGEFRREAAGARHFYQASLPG